ncbi:3-hydroxybutyrate oligomer hydrolase family protein [Lysobacter humi (ex Lee et al. 2017)]
MPNPIRYILALALPVVLAGCATSTGSRTMHAFGDIRATEHRDGDDLLTAGLGLEGLRGAAPAFADPAAPTAVELRRRAIWSSWRGIADLSPAGGYGRLYGSTAAVPGREFHAFATVPGARQPHRVAAQVPDAYDRDRRCLVVAASSGSRGVYGAIAVAAPWALPRGCAIAYTDRGAGSDYYDLDARLGVSLDGIVQRGDVVPLAFAPSAGGQGIAFKHAHSGDNPERDWGRHVRQAAEFGLAALTRAFPEEAPYTFDDTRVIAVGISNGGGAVLQAAGLEGDWLDAVVAGEPNVHVADAPPLYDIATEAALLMPCALRHLGVALPPTAMPSCDDLTAAGVPGAVSAADAPRAAYDALRARGWTDETLRANATYVAFDLWQSIAAAYASAYGRFGPGEHPCGYRYAAVDASGAARAATATERAAWWSDASGIPPGAGVSLLAPPGTRIDALRCLRALWTGDGDAASRVRAGITETRASIPRAGLPVMIVHGLDDGLIPPMFTSAPYVAAARARGRDVRLWEIEHAQHFDAFLGLPTVGPHYVPMLPYVYAALDRVAAHLDGGAMPADARVRTVPRGSNSALDAKHLMVPRP